MKLPKLPLTILLTAITACCLRAAPGSVRIWFESAPSPAGPWTRLDPTQMSADANGNPLIPADQAGQFFRTRIEPIEATAGESLSLTEVPAGPLGIAQRTLAEGRSVNDPEAWPPDAQLAPEVVPVYDPAQGAAPSFLEFKVRRSTVPPVRTGLMLNYPEDCRSMDLGSILVSLTNAEPPVPQFSTAGPAMYERLAKSAKTRDFRVMRYGGDFWVAEDKDGRQLANFGAQPFRLDPALVDQLRQPMVWSGDDELGSRTDPPQFAGVAAGFYRDYEEFKQDYLTNAIYQKLRQRRAFRARSEWQIEQGIFPTVLNLLVNQTQDVLTTVTPDDFFVDQESDEPLLTVAAIPGGGLKLTALAIGNAVLEVLQGATVHRIAIHITAPAALAKGGGGAAAKVFTPGWYVTYEKYIDTFNEQPQYEQMYSADWDGAIGCGPNAWGTLLAWWERQRGNYVVFGNLVQFDAPASYVDGDSKAKLKPVVKSLRQLMGGIKDPGSDNFATLPWDMPKGPLGYTDFYATAGWVARSWDMRWSDLFQTLNGGGGATESRTGIKKGYCTVVGLGNYWHYGVAYGYRVKEYFVTENGPSMGYSRKFRCNMCWGPYEESRTWRDFYDTFFSSRFKVKLTALAPPSQ